jgi:hypothetical protein
MNRTLASVVFHPRTPADLANPGPSPVVETAGRQIGTAATSANPPPPLHPQRDLTLALTGTRRSVLICDDRPDVRHELSQALRSDSRDPVHEVPDGTALLDSYEGGADQVLIGVHSGTTIGTEAVELLLATHPDAAPIVFG